MAGAADVLDQCRPPTNVASPRPASQRRRRSVILPSAVVPRLPPRAPVAPLAELLDELDRDRADR
jgi:hypothetical protein